MNIYAKYHVLFFLLGVSFFLPKTFGQQNVGRSVDRVELVRNLYRKHVGRMGQPTIVVDINGRHKRVWSNGAENYFFSELIFFENEDTVAELELVGNQKQSFKKIVQQWRESISEIRKKISEVDSSGEPNAQKSLVEKLRETNRNGFEEIDQLLASKQRQRLSQIRFRFLIRTRGVYTIFKDKNLSNYLGLIERDWNLVNGQQRRWRAEIIMKLSEAQQDIVNSLLKGLKEDQKSVVKREWPHLFESKDIKPDRLRIDLVQTEEYKQLKDFDPVFEKVERFPTYVMQISGKWQPRFSRYKADESLVDFNTCKHFFELLAIPSFRQQLDISERQFAILKVLKITYREKVMLASREYVAYKKNDQETFDQMLSRVDGIRQNAGKDTLNGIRQTLLKPQYKKFVKVGEQKISRLYGPVFDLVHGELGERLELSEQRKAAIKRAAEKALQKFENKTIELETLWLERIFSKLSEKKRQNLFRLLGKPLKETPPSFSVYLEQ